MITKQHTQESMSRSYIHAIAGRAGVNLLLTREFDYGFDGTFREVIVRGGRRVESGFPLDFQLKCTTNWRHEGDLVAYNIETKTYNDLVTRHPLGVGAVLILLCIPPEEESWVEFSEEAMMLRRCCYYSVLSGDPVPNENSKKRISIPRANVLSADSLRDLISSERNRKVGAGR